MATALQASWSIGLEFRPHAAGEQEHVAAGEPAVEGGHPVTARELLPPGRCVTPGLPLQRQTKAEFPRWVADGFAAGLIAHPHLKVERALVVLDPERDRRLLIAGASILVGTAAVERFLSDGWKVIGISLRRPEVHCEGSFWHGDPDHRLLNGFCPEWFAAR